MKTNLVINSIYFIYSGNSNINKSENVNNKKVIISTGDEEKNITACNRRDNRIPAV